MQGTLQIMDRTGHKTLTWDTEVKTRNVDPDLGPVDQSYVDREFDRLVSQGWLGVSTDPTTHKKEQLRRGELNVHEHELVTLIPPMQGG